MDNEDILSLINNITSKNRLDKLVHVINELIIMDKNINYKTIINKKTYNIFNLIDYYQTELNCNNVGVLNNLSYKYINQYKYEHKIQNWCLYPITWSIVGMMNQIEIITSPINSFYFFTNPRLCPNYFSNYKICSKLAIKTNNTVYYLDEETLLLEDTYDPLNLTYILNIEKIQINTKLPTVLLENIYSYLYSYKLIII